MFTESDYHWMAKALQLAENGRYTAHPNPCVGCVIVREGELLGEGWHYRAGDPHAEVNAIRSTDKDIRGACAYVTLEPCNHDGRTGPCTQQLIQKGIIRVVYAMKDPNPLVGGQGLAALQKAGLKVDGPLMEVEARALNPGFISRMERQLPWLRCKMAASLDGRTALDNGDSQWITGPAARSDVQRWRARSSAIITGIGSILQDNSRLTLRADELNLPNTADVVNHPPLRVVLDSHLRIPLDAQVLQGNTTLVFTTESASVNAVDKVETLRSKACTVIPLANGPQGRLDLLEILSILVDHYQCNEVLLEAGATLAGAFLQQQLIDEFIIYQAPVLLGSHSMPLFELPISFMSEKIHLNIVDCRQIGQDQRIIAHPVLEPRQN